MKRKNYEELKAVLTGKKQEVKRLKKVLRFTKEVHKSILEDYHIVQEYLKKELVISQQALKESRRKKWYQFERI